MNSKRKPGKNAVNGAGFRKTGVATILLASILNATASAAVIDFEEFNLGDIINNQNPIVSISADNFNNNLDLAVIFDSTVLTGEDADLLGPFQRESDGAINNPGNILIIQEGGDCDDISCQDPDDEGRRAAGKFFIEFTELITLQSIDFFDIEEPESMGTIQLFGGSGELLPDMFAVPDTGGDNKWDSVTFDIDGVKRIEIFMGGSGAIDNITYSVVPLPAAVWLFGSGLGLLAWMRRNKTLI